MASQVTTTDATANWIRAHQVCCEVQPLKEMIKGVGVRQTGIEVLVYAQHGGPRHLDPTAPEHTELFATLHELAERMLPPGHFEAARPVAAEEDARLETRHYSRTLAGRLDRVASLRAAVEAAA